MQPYRLDIGHFRNFLCACKDTIATGAVLAFSAEDAATGCCCLQPGVGFADGCAPGFTMADQRLSGKRCMAPTAVRKAKSANARALELRQRRQRRDNENGDDRASDVEEEPAGDDDESWVQ